MSSLPDDSTETPAPGAAYQLCLQELRRENPDYRIAHVYATLSLEETLREVVGQLAQLSKHVLVAGRRRY